jgi:hypothetical protein
VSTHSGSVTDQEFLESYRTLFENPNMNLGYRHLVDLRDANCSPRSTAALRSFAVDIRNRCGGAGKVPKTAVIAPNDVSFGLARMYEAFADVTPREFIVVRSAEAALSWLGLPDAMNEEANPTLGSKAG